MNDDEHNDDDSSGKLPIQLPALLYIMQVQFGLLDEMVSAGLLDRLQVEDIESAPTLPGQIQQLLLQVSKMPREKQEQFLTALDNTQQSHVANFLRHNGQRPEETDDWPINECSEYKILEHNCRQLVDLVDTRNGLLDELLSVQCINDRQQQLIGEKLVDAESNAKLLDIIRRKNVADFKKFVTCLAKTKQHHVVSLLVPNCSTNVQPVNEKRIATLTANYSAIVRLIDVKNSGLLAELLAMGGITWQQKEFIESATTPSESNRRLLRTVKRGSEQDFDKFIQCLKNTKQTHVSRIFCGEGIVSQMIAQTSGPANLADHEAQVVRQFKYVMSISSTENRQLMLATVNDYAETLESNGVQLIGMQTEHSIKLFFFCSSLSGLQILNELYVADQLKCLVQKIINVLLDNKQLVTVDRIKWKLSDYSHCAQYLFNESGMPFSSRIYQLVQQLPDSDNEPLMSSVSVDQFPHELIELLLLKTTGQLFAIMKNVTSNADICALITVRAVCHYWWVTLTCRQSNRKLLRRCFEHLCAPYGFKPKLAHSCCIQEGSSLLGVAEFNYKLYVVSGWSNVVKVLSMAPSGYCKYEEDLKVPELRRAADLVACGETRCLYICDRETHCIWRVSFLSPIGEDGTVDKLVETKCVPWSLSVQFSRLLITADDGPTLYAYKCDGEFIRKIELPPYMMTSHAVETSDGTVIVCHSRRVGDTEPDHRAGISEVSFDGRVLRRYEGSEELCSPYYMTIDCSGKHILVCDRSTKVIFHFNRELKLQQALLTKLTDQPIRMCCSQKSGKLYICCYESSYVNIYSIASH